MLPRDNRSAEKAEKKERNPLLVGVCLLTTGGLISVSPSPGAVGRSVPIL
jgi:hypothetical protein